MNNKSNTHTTTLINVHNRIKHATTENDNVIPSNNYVILFLILPGLGCQGHVGWEVTIVDLSSYIIIIV